jgi:hypothetical protein
MVATGVADPMVSRCEAMRELWERARLKSVETEVIRIPVAFFDFDDFWNSNTVPIGPQGKLIDRISMDEKERLRTRLHDHLPTDADGRIVYESFANAVEGRVPLRE